MCAICLLTSTNCLARSSFFRCNASKWGFIVAHCSFSVPERLSCDFQFACYLCQIVQKTWLHCKHRIISS
jgi:hypothetical protein